MGNEATCRVAIDRDEAEAKVLLETEELIVRGGLKAKIAFRDAKDVRAEDGFLLLRWQERAVRIHLGKDAAKWAEKIRNPKSVLDKIGVKAGQKVSIVGTLDPTFTGDVEARSGDVSSRLRSGSDVIFFAAAHRDELDHLPKLRASLTPAGAVWVVRPKGTTAIADADVMAAAKAAGLVDVKVVRFSETHTAEKLVIPRLNRGDGR
jgi:hypothetical protein